MVGTVAPLEAMLLGGVGTSEQRVFVARAGGFMIVPIGEMDALWRGAARGTAGSAG
jgi:hypothetical protein